MRLKEIINKIEKDFPLNLSYSWDNCGLLVGDGESHIDKILTCLEANESIIDEAIKNKVNLIITHHPFLFKGIKKIEKNDLKGRLIYKLIKNDISIYSMHTNFDIAKNGMNDYIMELLGVNDSELLDITSSENLFKYCVYCPIENVDEVRDAIFKANSFEMGNYSNTSFNLDGIGTFKPNDNAKPHIGELGNLEYVKETKIEVICTKKDISNIVEVVKKVHPYEEIAYEIIAIENKGKENGIGRIGTLNKDYDLKSFAIELKEKFELENIRVVGDIKKKIRKVAVVSGAGFEYVKKARNMGADVFLTGDVKYHEAQDTLDMNMSLIDLGHYGSEKIFSKIIKNYIIDNLNIETIETSLNIDPFINI